MFLTNHKFLFVGASKKQKDIWTKFVISNGGIIADPRPQPIFTPTHLPLDLTHIVVENKTISFDNLKKTLNCTDISPHLHIVESTWITNVIRMNGLLAEEDYLIFKKRVITTEDDSLKKRSRQDGYDEKHVYTYDSNRTDSEETNTRENSSVVLHANVIGNNRFIPMLRNPVVDFSSFHYHDWNEHDTLLFRYHNDISSYEGRNFIGFDLDGTIIRTKSKKTHAIDSNDWEFLHPNIPSIFKDLYDNQNKSIVVFSNQGGISTMKTSITDFKIKIDNILKILRIPIDFMCAMNTDLYRKPCTGMLDFYQAYLCHQLRHNGTKNHSIESNRNHSRDILLPNPLLELYVGDAAGRPAVGTGKNGRKKDFSDSDLKFALNVGCQFQTPEAYFLKSSKHIDVHIECRGITLSALVRVPYMSAEAGKSNLESLWNPNMEQEIILIVAPAASGKSSLTNKLICLYQHQDRLHSYNRCCHRINQDHLKSLEKCLRLGRLILSSNESMPTDAYCSQIARNKKSCTTNNTAICETATDNHTTNGQVTGVFVNSIIVDNTNLSHTVRKAWVDLAKEFNIQVQCAFINPLMSFIRCICIEVSSDVSIILEKLRRYDPSTLPEDLREVPSNMHKEKKWPSKDEGFDRIDIIPFTTDLPVIDVNETLGHRENEQDQHYKRLRYRLCHSYIK